MKHVIGIIALSALISACSSVPKDKIVYRKVYVKTDSYCQADKQIKWDERDTKGTINRIDRHNAAYRKACKK